MVIEDKKSNSCTWCIVGPLENCIYGLRIYKCSCNHNYGKNNFQTKISYVLILFFIILCSFNISVMVFFGLKLANEEYENNNQVLLISSYTLMSFWGFTMTVFPVLLSKYRILDIHSSNSFLENGYKFGMKGIINEKEFAELRKRCAMLGCVVVGQPLSMFLLYVVEVFLKGSTTHVERFLAIVTNYIFYSLVLQAQSVLLIYETMQKNMFRHLKQYMVLRLRETENKKYTPIKYIFENKVKQINRIIDSTSVNKKIFMNYCSLGLIISLCILPFILVVSVTLLCNTIINYGKLSLDMVIMDTMYVFRLFALGPPLLHLLNSAQNFKKPVSMSHLDYILQATMNCSYKIIKFVNFH